MDRSAGQPAQGYTSPQRSRFVRTPVGRENFGRRYGWTRVDTLLGLNIPYPPRKVDRFRRVEDTKSLIQEVVVGGVLIQMKDKTESEAVT